MVLLMLFSGYTLPFLLLFNDCVQGVFFERKYLTSQEAADILVNMSSLNVVKSINSTTCVNTAVRDLNEKDLAQTAIWINTEDEQCHIGKLPKSTVETLRDKDTRRDGEAFYIQGFKTCPRSHPFAIGGELSCCSRKVKNFDSHLRPECNGTLIDPFDPVECCPLQDHISCSDSKRKCKSVRGAQEKLLIARQDIRQEAQTFNLTNYLDLNKEDPSAEMYSRLFQLEDFRGLDGKFHFKLCYPTLVDTLAQDQCYEFKQTSHPLSITQETQDVEGFEIIQQLYAQELLTPFLGLRSDSPDRAYLDGNNGTKWWQSILVSSFNPLLGNEIPVVEFSLENRILTKFVELYVII